MTSVCIRGPGELMWPGSDFQNRQHRSAPLPDEGWWATLYAEIIPFEQRLEVGRVLRHIEYLWPCARGHGLRQLGGAILLQQRVQYAGYPHTHITPTERPSLCLGVIWRRGQTLQAFVALGKLVTPLQAAFAAPDCAGGLDYRTQYRHITLCTLRHRSPYKPLRALHDLTSTTPNLPFQQLGGPPL